MRAFLRRVAFYLLTAWAALTINFVLPRFMPGNPVQAMLTRFQGSLSPNAVYALRRLFGETSSSLWSQYLEYWHNMFTGNFGVSIGNYPIPASEIVGQAIGWTIGLVGVCTILAFAAGSLMGLLAGWRRGRWLEGLLPVTTFISSIPYFWFGLVMVYLFAIVLHWFPISGAYTNGLPAGLSWPFIGSVLDHGILPALTLVIASLGYWVLSTRNMMITTLAEDYILVAEAKGLSPRRIFVTYAARNAILPSIAGFAISLGTIVGGSIVMEIVFNYPGIGYVLFQAVNADDYPVMQAVFLIITLTVLAANLLADSLYVLLDPRTRAEG